jgi:hypothetical protein
MSGMIASLLELTKSALPFATCFPEAATHRLSKATFPFTSEGSPALSKIILLSVGDCKILLKSTE